MVEEAERAFDVGDYKRLRQIAKQLMSSGDTEVVQEGERLSQKLKLDPAQIVVVVGCLMIFLFALWRYVL